MMRHEDVAGLSDEQIASKFALPQVPTHVTEISVPSGYQLRTTIANDINIFSDKSVGGNGGGGFQFELRNKPENKSDLENWFPNAMSLK